jgi:hypothetical protein
MSLSSYRVQSNEALQWAVPISVKQNRVEWIFNIGPESIFNIFT